MILGPYAAILSMACPLLRMFHNLERYSYTGGEGKNIPGITMPRMAAIIRLRMKNTITESTAIPKAPIQPV